MFMRAGLGGAFALEEAVEKCDQGAIVGRAMEGVAAAATG